MISIEAAEKQLSPLEELMAIHGKFISLRELVEQIKRRYPSMTCGQVALWLVNKLEGLDDYHRRDFQVKKLMRGHKHDLLKSVAKHGAEVMNNNNQFDEICVRREDAEGKLNIEFPVMPEFLPPVLTVNDCTYQDDEYHHADNSVSDINNDPSPPAVWENTHGMETAKKFIAGLAIAIAANDKRYQRKDGFNKSAVARLAESALLKYGVSIGVSDRQLTELISEALKCAPKLKDYTDSEQP
ncbi:hypothetical protein DOI44_22805 [Salmonella enterica subsp. enterica serovar Panama]|uniref:Uncharacterized protein n=2 Tax=Salmonella enterica TaxID=28901 RepID=A0A5U8JF73_SALET|nr:hypothetical protein LFZ16_21375 [Salmonella enterica subsp. enterica serovar India str. SA20085604]EAT2562507.1 hypothetical protein [Salmonella enterica]EBR7997177.1 hypothetical protein [Salmonella enterica subsp. enterica serovar Panama]EBR8435790.1 hypothetical protein [Salmonella enterica subsp. enterica serovar Panama]EBW9462494.1 hypothetical protein [Salmonella enterica subsp. enterica serovar Panama]